MRTWSTNDHRGLLGKPLVQAILPLAERRGVSSAELFKGTALSEKKLQMNNFRLTGYEMLSLLASAERRVKDPQLWQLVIETLFGDRLTPLIDLIVHAKNLKHALIFLSRFQNLLHPFVFTPTQRHTSYLQLDLLPLTSLTDKMKQPSYHANCKMGIATLLMLGKARGLEIGQWQIFLPGDIAPLPTWSKWTKTVSFRPICGMKIPLTHLNKTAVRRDKSRYQQALSFCEIQNQPLTQPAFMLIVFKWLTKQVEIGADVSLKELASEVGLSLSSCKRLLSNHGYSFQQAYDLVRLHKLLNLLQRHPYSNVELAQQLGYSNPHSFRRACKRWLGVVPDELRQQHAALITPNSAL